MLCSESSDLDSSCTAPTQQVHKSCKFPGFLPAQKAAGAVDVAASLAVGAAPHNSTKWQLCGRKILFLVLKEISELIGVKRIRLWAGQIYVSALSVSVTNPSCRVWSLYWLSE